MLLAETWELGATGWRQIPTTLEPSGRIGAGMAYDAARREVVRRPGEDLAEGHRSSARRRSSAVRASVKSSSAPPSTCSSGTFSFTRWSVTRLCG